MSAGQQTEVLWTETGRFDSGESGETERQKGLYLVGGDSSSLIGPGMYTC